VVSGSKNRRIEAGVSSQAISSAMSRNEFKNRRIEVGFTVILRIEVLIV
jgi:hypothetical protein